MNIIIKRILTENIDRGLNLIWKVFQEYVAPYYTKEGIDFFHSTYIDGERFRNKIKNGEEIMFGAFVQNELVGVLILSCNNTVSCAFVDGKYHRMGIGKALFEMVISELKQRGEKELKLNASPYAIGFYHALGFEDMDVQSDYNGILYTPMLLNLCK